MQFLVQALALFTLARAAAGSVSLISVRSTAFKSTPVLEEGKQVCAELVNKGTYFTVDVEVGTPGQRFSVVADTGSNTLIVPSCLCQQAGYCSKQDRCFTGTNKSSTFTLIKTEMDQPVALSLSFGSGVIRGVLAIEHVTVGGLKADMKKGILLMTAKALNFAGPFEGILGLGIPSKEKKKLLRRPRSPKATPGARRVISGQDVGKIIDWLKNQIGSQGGGGGAFDPSRAAASLEAQVARWMDEWETWEDGQRFATQPAVPGGYAQPSGFLEQAGVSTFGICFNEGKNGVLRLGMPTDNSVPVHASVGEAHWGLGLSGISLSGKKRVDLKMCSNKDLMDGQDTACGAIPDSGTTMITGPKEGIRLLLDSICDSWELCHANYTALEKARTAAEKAAANAYGTNPFAIEPWPKYKVLEMLLFDCEDWISKGDGLDGLPKLEFHVTGAKGTRQTLDMPGHAYIIERSLTAEKDLNLTRKSIKPLSPAEKAAEEAFEKIARGRNKVCSPAFSVLDYKTTKNGPVWILGTPFFYQFNVGYDLGTKPPSLSLTPTSKSPCGFCDNKVGLVAQGAEVYQQARRSRPLPLMGQPRGPSFDLGQPL